ncbi:anthranilate synthase component II [uncultured Helicobacter sp.]|uniref:anthranilate synthase component II n=1 Tax=uncultured Helicobacter sp. TaxID=175537 RepID=UPI00374E5277
MILLIDNYDSFSYNLYQLLGSLHNDVRVVRNDELSAQEIRELHPSLLVISPGPGRPEDAGVCVEAINLCAGEVPIFGVCLGHQAITLAFGGEVSYAKRIMHGKSSLITIHKERELFGGLPAQIQVARYHSLASARDSLPKCLEILASSEDGEIMALAHREYAIYGVQFHPESVLTPNGRAMLVNLLHSQNITQLRNQ